MSTDKTKVAIACQGGGSHTAFTAGVLERFLVSHGSDYEITALTGTSGGAMCAVLTWYGLRTGDADKASQLLDGFWTDLKATLPVERLVNESVVWSNRLLHNGFPLWQFSPEHNPAATQGKRWLHRTLQNHLDDRPLDELIVDPEQTDEPSPAILVSAVDINDGSFDIFTDRPETSSADGDASVATASAEPSRERPRLQSPTYPISIDAVLASAAVPPLFDAVALPELTETNHAYWDGLLSQNPPVRNLLTGSGMAEEKPDEIWVVRINPTTRDDSLTSLEAINNRRNELAGSLSLRQELYFIEQVNRWLRKGAFTDQAAQKYKQITVRQLELDETRLNPPRQLVTSTKLDRDGAFINELRDLGATQAKEFLAERDSDRYVIVE